MRTTMENRMPYGATTPESTRSETILVVDDDTAVRNITMRSLRSRGYDVLGDCDGASALQMSAEFAGTIHLVLSDAMMPGMNGASVVHGLRCARPGLKAVFMSGYGDDVVSAAIRETHAGFVQKPFTFSDLLRSVREQLDS